MCERGVGSKDSRCLLGSGRWPVCLPKAPETDIIVDEGFSCLDGRRIPESMFLKYGRVEVFYSDESRIDSLRLFRLAPPMITMLIFVWLGGSWFLDM